MDQNEDKVGVGILTCNRRESFFRLFDQVKSNTDVSQIEVVKNREYDYGEQLLDIGDRLTVIKDDCGVGKCKNAALVKLLDSGCKHIFLIEDDIELLDSSVFQKYITTAKKFKLGHLNWNTLPEIAANNQTYSISYDGDAIDISFRLCGCFSYFSREALQQVGLVDSANYVNVLEHAEHAYRMSLMKQTTPFYAFADVHDGQKLLKNTGEGSSTIDHQSALYHQRMAAAYGAFRSTYGKNMSQVNVPTQEEVIEFLRKKAADEL